MIQGNNVRHNGREKCDDIDDDGGGGDALHICTNIIVYIIYLIGNKPCLMH